MTMENQTIINEWMTAAQSKERFGIGFGRLMKMADEGAVDRRQLPPDDHGDVAFLFRVEDVRNYIEGADDGRKQ